MNIIKKYKLKRQKNFYNLIPTRNYDYEINNEGLVIVLIPRFDDNLIGRWLKSKSDKREIRTDLDDIGSELWKLIDNEKTVYEISKEYKNNIDISINQLEERVLIFFSMLYNNGLINFKNL